MSRFRSRHRTFRLNQPKPRNENSRPELTARNVAHPPRLAPHEGANNASNPRSPNRIPPSASKYHAMRATRLSGHNPASCSRLRTVEEDHMLRTQVTCYDYRVTIAENLDYRLDTGADGVGVWPCLN